MPSIYDLKPKFQNLWRPMVRSLAHAGISANQVTVSALILSFIVGGLIAWRPESHAFFLLLPAALFVRMALNAIDGMLAREHNMKTPLGAVLNELGDVLSDAVLYAPFALIPGVPSGLVFVIVFLATVSEMTGVVGIQIGASRHYEGPMGKSDRAFVFGALGLALGFGAPSGAWITYFFAAILVLLVVTIINRARGALREVPA